MEEGLRPPTRDELIGDLVGLLGVYKPPSIEDGWFSPAEACSWYPDTPENTVRGRLKHMVKKGELEEKKLPNRRVFYRKKIE